MGITPPPLISTRKALLIISPVVYLTATGPFSAYFFSLYLLPKRIYLTFSKNLQVVNHCIWVAFHDGI